MAQRTVLVAAWLLAAGPGCLSSGAAAKRTTEAAARPEGPLPIPADLAAHLDEAEQYGRSLYLADKAAAAATDVLFEHIDRDNPPGKVAGYLTVRDGDDDGKPRDSYSTFFFTDEKPARIRFRVRIYIRPGPLQSDFEAPEPPATPSPDIQMLFRAQQAALAAAPKNGQPINPLLMPAGNGGRDVLVYLLAGSKKREMVLGRHFRVLVSLDGTKVRQVLPLSNTAVVLPLEQKTEAAAITHVVTDWPLETHVFASLLYKVPIYVATIRGLWRVQDGRIQLIEAENPGSERQRSP